MDVAPHFTDHEVCGNGGEWINGPSLSLVDRSRAFHPNAIGQKEYATPLNQALAGSTSAQSLSSASFTERQKAHPRVRELPSHSSPGHLGALEVLPTAASPGCVAARPAVSGDRLTLRGGGFEPATTIDIELVRVADSRRILSRRVTSSSSGELKEFVRVPTTLTRESTGSWCAALPRALGICYWFELSKWCQTAFRQVNRGYLVDFPEPRKRTLVTLDRHPGSRRRPNLDRLSSCWTSCDVFRRPQVGRFLG